MYFTFSLAIPSKSTIPVDSLALVIKNKELNLIPATTFQNLTQTLYLAREASFGRIRL